MAVEQSVNPTRVAKVVVGSPKESCETMTRPTRGYREEELLAAMMAHPSCGTAGKAALIALGRIRDAQRISGR